MSSGRRRVRNGEPAFTAAVLRPAQATAAVTGLGAGVGRRSRRPRGRGASRRNPSSPALAGCPRYGSGRLSEAGRQRPSRRPRSRGIAFALRRVRAG